MLKVCSQVLNRYLEEKSAEQAWPHLSNSQFLTEVRQCIWAGAMEIETTSRLKSVLQFLLGGVATITSARSKDGERKLWKHWLFSSEFR